MRPNHSHRAPARNWKRRVIVCIGVATLVFLVLSTKRAQQKMRTEDDKNILNSSEDQLKTAQGKLTYLGAQEKPIRTVVFAPVAHHIRMEYFVPVESDRQYYANDSLPPVSFTLTPSELKRLLTAVRPIIENTDCARTRKFLSFSMVIENGDGVRGHEFCVDPHKGQEFYRAVLSSLEDSNLPASRAVTNQMLNIYPPVR